MVDPKRLNAELRRMKHLINTDPRVKAHFDRDGNGVIDGDEWEQVRQLVIRRLERAEADSTAAASQSAPQAPMQEGAVAERILDKDLRPMVAAAQPSSQGAPSVFVLEQQGGLGQMFEGMSRRQYQVYGANGQAIATIQQVENEAIQGLNQRGFSVPDLHFRVSNMLTGVRLTLQKNEAIGSNIRIGVLNDKGGEIAHAQLSGTLGRLLESQAHVHSSLVQLGLVVKRKLLRPWTYDISTEAGNTVGYIERGWSGLGGFLTGGNKMRIEVEPGRVTEEIMWGLVACALMFDLSQEEK